MSEARAKSAEETRAMSAEGAPVTRGDRLRTWWAQALIVIGVCVMVYWVGLGRHGLRSTEGHRAIPGWTALETGAWLPTRMFEAVYMRKPPGMAWAIAASSMVFGETEFAARVPSAIGATLLALMAWWFSRRWFGARWGVYGGLAQALLPSAWPPGRSAEIETLNSMFCALAVWCLMDAVVFARNPSPVAARHPLPAGRGEVVEVNPSPVASKRCDVLSPQRGEGLEPNPSLVASRGRAIAIAALGGVGVLGTALMKGPGALACCIGAAGACAVVVGWRRAARSAALWVWAGVGAAGVAALAVVLARATVREPGFDSGVSDKLVFYHLWRRDELMEYVWLAPLTFAMTLPAGFALLFPWGGDAKREAVRDGHDDGAPGAGPAPARSFEAARTLAWGFVLSLGVFLAVGVANARYTMPTAVFVPALVAYVARGAAGAFDAKRARIARVMLLGNPRAWIVVSLGAAMWWMGLREPARGMDSGKAPGIELAASLPDGAEVWAHWMVESRPEALWYAQREAAREGRRVRVRWMPKELEGVQAPPTGVFVFLADWGEGSEAARWIEKFGAGLEEVKRLRVHETEGVLARVR